MTKGNYVDGFVLVVPDKKAAAYKKMAKEGAAAWLKYGALDYKECRADDVGPKKGNEKALLFPGIAGAKKGESVWFSYIVFKNKKHRDAVNKKVMKYFEEKYKDMDMKDMPMDPTRMAYGGFKVEVGA